MIPDEDNIVAESGTAFRVAARNVVEWLIQFTIALVVTLVCLGLAIVAVGFIAGVSR